MITIFREGEALDTSGKRVPAWGFEHGGDFIVNARASPCGRFHADPAGYGLTSEDAARLARLNEGRELMAYWDL